jgi:ADP-ribosylglycohydrolase
MIDKFQASMLGYAIGDALAAPIEDVVRYPDEGEEIVKYYTRAARSHPLAHLQPGQYSDETQLMLLVARSLSECGCFSIKDLERKFIDWSHSQKKRSEWRFPGNTVITACRKLAAGATWETSGLMSAGSNAVCRTLPYALAFCKSSSMLKTSLDKSCRLSHTDPRCLGTSLAFASVINMGLSKEEFSVDFICSRAVEKAQPYAIEMGRKLNIVKDSLKLDSKRAIANIGNSGYCIDTFAAALYWFLRAEGRFDNMIIGAANSGGDSDAIAAMAGAMFGAWFGLAAIPEKWFEKLENYEEIKLLACNIYRIAIPESAV